MLTAQLKLGMLNLVIRANKDLTLVTRGNWVLNSDICRRDKQPDGRFILFVFLTHACVLPSIVSLFLCSL